MPRKLSEVMKEMSQRLLRDPEGVPSAEAAHLALVIANIAWNESVGLVHVRDGYGEVWEAIEAENPNLWNEFKSTDIDSMIDDMVEYKQRNFADDQRRILTCGMLNQRIRVESLPPATPDVDSKWEMELYGLVRTHQDEKAIAFVQDTQGVSRQKAAKQVKEVARNLGMA
jgi:hypothetical protein